MSLQPIFSDASIAGPLKSIAQKVLDGKRISTDECLQLYKFADIDLLGYLANHIKTKRHGNKVFFNRNFHIEPTNVCVFSCAFCAYSKLYKNREDGWELTEDQMMNIVKSYDDKKVTEVHIVGGVHPKLTIEFFADLMRKMKAHRPSLHIKGYTAVELDYMFRKAKMTNKEGLEYLREAGLESLPGGGAEIFDEEIREKICADKVDAKGWLDIHKTAHEMGMHTNATMLYGHIEKFEHRIDHMNRLRELQDETGGFNCFIPLKFRNQDNDMSHIEESPVIDDIKTYSIGRIFMDNFDHVKAYWPMLGREKAQLMVNYGVDDLDGTIDDSTKIYSMAGSEEQNPALSTEQITDLIHQSGNTAVERDTLYNELEVFELT